MIIDRKMLLSAPILSREEERQALHDIHERNCEKALLKIVLAFGRMAAAEASLWARAPSEHADLLSSGLTGIVRAAYQFDLSRANRFATYASWWVKTAIIEHVNEMHFPVSMTREDLSCKRADRDGVTISCINLDDQIEETGQTVRDTIPSSDPTPEEIHMTRAQAAFLREALDTAAGTLDTTSRQIVFRSSLPPNEPIEAVASDLGIAPDRARRLRQRAMMQMRRSLLMNGISPSALG